MLKAGIKTSEFWGLIGAGTVAVQYAPAPWNVAVPGILAGLWAALRTAAKFGLIRGTVGGVVRELDQAAPSRQ